MYDTLRAAVMAAIILRMMPVVVPASLGRCDQCLSIFSAFCARADLSIQVSGTPAVEAGGVLWVSNHFSWMDYPVLQMASRRLLRVIARADMGAEGLFGVLALRVLRNVGVIEYQRGDKGSGANVRRALHAALTTERVPVLLFPEGTSQVQGPPKPFRIGGLQACNRGFKGLITLLLLS